MRTKRFHTVFLVGIALHAVATRAEAQLRAEEITSRNAAELLLDGPDAVGGLGDYYLANDVVELIVDHPSRRHAILNHGGTIVDVGLRDRRGEDQFARLVPMVNMSQRVFLNYDEIRAEVEPDRHARLVVTSSGMSSLPRGSSLARALDVLVPAPDEIRNVRVETVYELRPGEAEVRLSTRFTNTGSEPAPVFAYGDLWMRGGRSMRVFLGNVLAPELARGFHHRTFSRTNLLSSLDALAPFSHAVVVGLPAYPPIAYGLYSPKRTAAGRSFFGVSGEHVTFAMAFAGDPGWQELSALRLMRVLRQRLEPGETWEVERRLVVAGRADVAALTDRLLPALLGTDASSGLEGVALPADVRTIVHVHTSKGHPVTQLEAVGGRYAAKLPPGRYRLTLLAEHRPAVLRVAEVGEGATAPVQEVRWPPLGALRFEPAFADGGPGRVIFRGRDGTSTPVFGAELLDFRLDGVAAPSATETSSAYFIGNARDPRLIPLPVGRYTLVATRGLEHDIDTREVEIATAGDVVRVEPFEVQRVAELPEYVSADLHVHAQASDDSGTTNAARLRDFVAADVEVLVATDHERVPDYDGALTELGLIGRIRVLRGVEVTSSAPSFAAPFTIGHHNAWPVPFQPWVHRRGAPPSQNLTLAELYAQLRTDYRAGVVQLNHPRGKLPGVRDGNFFTHQGGVGSPVDTHLPLAAEANATLLDATADGTRAIDFDAIEVMNGDSRPQYLATRDDFHWLLRQGHRRTATANSDSHGPDELAGIPRNYVRVGADWRDTRVFDSAIREGRSFGTNGPLVAYFAANGGGLGDIVAAPKGRVAVEYDVVTAPWIPEGEVRLLLNGEVVRVLREPSGHVELRVSRDAFLTLEAGAPLDAESDSWIATHRGVYTDVIAPGFVPTAFTNPIYIDADGDGKWTPPGLPPVGRREGRPTTTPAILVALLAALAIWHRKRSSATSSRA